MAGRRSQGRAAAASRPLRAGVAAVAGRTGQLPKEWVTSRGRSPGRRVRGRDAAGKGSTIKRVTGHLNPRVVRIAALPSPTELELYAVVFPAVHRAHARAGEIVLFDPSCIQPGRRRGGDGVLHSGRAPQVLASSADLRAACSSTTASCCAKYWSPSAWTSRNAGSARG